MDRRLMRSGLSCIIHRDRTGLQVGKDELRELAAAIEHYRDPEVSETRDDGRMAKNIAEFASLVVGKRVVGVDRPDPDTTRLHLYDGLTVNLRDEEECCAYTQVEGFVLHRPGLDYVVTDVTTRDGYQKWFLLDGAGAFLEFSVGWSAGDPFNHPYGFEIDVYASPLREG